MVVKLELFGEDGELILREEDGLSVSKSESGHPVVRYNREDALEIVGGIPNDALVIAELDYQHIIIGGNVGARAKIECCSPSSNTTIEVKGCVKRNASITVRGHRCGGNIGGEVILHDKFEGDVFIACATFSVKGEGLSHFEHVSHKLVNVKTISDSMIEITGRLDGKIIKQCDLALKNVEKSGSSDRLVVPQTVLENTEAAPASSRFNVR